MLRRVSARRSVQHGSIDLRFFLKLASRDQSDLDDQLRVLKKATDRANTFELSRSSIAPRLVSTTLVKIQRESQIETVTRGTGALAIRRGLQCRQMTRRSEFRESLERETRPGKSVGRRPQIPE